MSVSPADQLRLLRVAFWFLLLAGLAVLLLPLPVPTPVKIAVSATDFIAASIVWLARRQRLERLRSGPPR